MKTTLSFLIIFSILLMSCKNETKKPEATINEQPKSILEKIAHAHGYDHWNTVEEFHFTFNVDRDTSHYERSWIWKSKNNEITAITATDTLTYFRKEMDSVAYKTNAGFINDRYWVLAPFNLVWDQNNFEYEHSDNVTAPVSKESMQKLTIVYSNDGGYTPGDAYDFYFDDDYLLKEWVFRKGNQEEASLTTTWENYVEHGGLQLAQDHKKPEGGFNIRFTGLQVKTK